MIDRFYTERGTVNTFGLMLFSIVSAMIQTGLVRFVANILPSQFEILLFVVTNKFLSLFLISQITYVSIFFNNLLLFY